MRRVWFVLLAICAASPVLARPLTRTEALLILEKHPYNHSVVLEELGVSPFDAAQALLALQEYSAATLEPNVGEVELPAHAPLARFLARLPEGVHSPVWRHARDFAFEWYLLKLISDFSERAISSGAQNADVNAILDKSYHQTGRALLLLEGAIEQTKRDDIAKLEMVQQMLSELDLPRDHEARARFQNVLQHADSPVVRSRIVYDVDHSRLDRIRYGVAAFVGNGTLHSMFWAAGVAVSSAIFEIDAQTVSAMLMAAGAVGVLKGATTGLYLSGFPDARADVQIAQAPLRVIENACRKLF